MLRYCRKVLRHTLGFCLVPAPFRFLMVILQVYEKLPQLLKELSLVRLLKEIKGGVERKVGPLEIRDVQFYEFVEGVYLRW
jgi:hypothetical protein